MSILVEDSGIFVSASRLSFALISIHYVAFTHVGDIKLQDAYN